MPSHLIIGNHLETIRLAEVISPQKLVESPDCFLLANDEESLKISQVREIKHFLTRKPYREDSMVVFIPQAHRLTIQAQNALLKTLEEPPSHAVLILTTPYEERLLPTILSRCVVHYQKQDSLNETSNSFDIATLINTLRTATIGERIANSQEYAVPKTKGLTFCKELIDFYRTKLYEKPHYNHAKNIQSAQQTIIRLEQNIDPRLSIEHLFLELRV